MNRFSDLLRLMRPTQWTKNIFVFAGIFFAEEFYDPILLFRVTLAAVAFSLVSSCIYIINDIVDTDNDKHHPKKKNRPLPSGKVTTNCAIMLSAGCGLLGMLIALYVGGMVAGIILFYALLNIAYSFRFKHIVLLDVFCIATGFMLRILVGTVGVGIPPSQWLLLCGLMITLFLGFAKRRAEIITLTANKKEHRKVLEHYGPVLLDEIIAICAACVIISYSLYTMSPDTIAVHQTANLIYTVPFVIYALFRYIFLLHHCNGGGNPSRDLLKDRHIIASIFGWLVVTVYLFETAG